MDEAQKEWDNKLRFWHHPRGELDPELRDAASLVWIFLGLSLVPYA